MACAGLLWLVPGLLVMHIGPLGGEKPWCLETSLQLKSSAEPVTVAVKCTIWNLSLANIQAFQLFSFGEHLCVSWRWTESCGWRKNSAVYSQPLLFQLFCSTPVGDLSQRDVSSALMKSALAAFGFTQTFCKSVPGKFSLCVVLLFCFFHTLSPFLWKRSLQGPAYL